MDRADGRFRLRGLWFRGNRRILGTHPLTIFCIILLGILYGSGDFGDFFTGLCFLQTILHTLFLSDYIRHCNCGVLEQNIFSNLSCFSVFFGLTDYNFALLLVLFNRQFCRSILRIARFHQAFLFNAFRFRNGGHLDTSILYFNLKHTICDHINNQRVNVILFSYHNFILSTSRSFLCVWVCFARFYFGIGHGRSRVLLIHCKGFVCTLIHSLHLRLTRSCGAPCFTIFRDDRR
mmetsp:Transcript_17754/g.29393  ORF Transcript_17754/g.29393 Transcript_17754/m.29393 type:complete len:234 (-) Transcript_17754:3205-3906(-)